MPTKKKMTAAEDGELKIERVPVQARQLLRSAKSLRPGPSMMAAAAAGNPEAMAIRDAWKPNLPIRKVSRDEYEQMVERGTVVFGG